MVRRTSFVGTGSDGQSAQGEEAALGGGSPPCFEAALSLHLSHERPTAQTERQGGAGFASLIWLERYILMPPFESVRDGVCQRMSGHAEEPLVR